MAPQDGPDTRDRIVGCLLGGALGDALGGRYEGKPPPPQAIWGPPWALSDDTQLTLATCDAIVESGGVDPAKIAATFLRWLQDGRLVGLGAATRGALDALGKGGHWALVGRRGEYAAGNGAAMRIAPVGLWVDPLQDDGRRVIRDISRITHHNDEAYAGALAVAVAVHQAADGRPALPRLSEVACTLPDSAVRDRCLEMAELAGTESIAAVAGRFGSSGYVVESVPLALFAAQHAAELGLTGMLEQVVGAGGDTDTNAAIAGQVAGCLLGAGQLPPERVGALPDGDRVSRTASQFAAALVKARRNSAL